ncbi:MAG: hypothetical protein Kow001_10610 [Acidobacteriota bacterium]
MTGRSGSAAWWAVALLATGLALAGGPRNLDQAGVPIKWDPPTAVPYTIDQGPLRSTGISPLSNDVGAGVVHAIAGDWNDVASARITLIDNGFLPLDINATNYKQYFGLPPHGPVQVRPENPIVFDADGSLTNDFFGAGSSQDVLGFAGIRFFQGNRYLSGWAVLNGTRATGSNVNTTFRQTVLHEMGHFLGLDHSQGKIENFNQFASFGKHVPVMFPIGGLNQLPNKPIADDIAWLSWLYPEPDFPNTTGTIKGRVFRRSGGPFQGANVVAAPAILQPDGTYVESRENIISVVSDFLALNTGEFELPGLAPGAYFVFIDPLRDDFVEGSGVGPFDQRPTNFPRDYYSEDESAIDDPNQKTLIQVAAGQTVEGIEITANEIANRLDLLGDDDEMLYEFSGGFAFPFFGRLYRSVVVNSDGNLTFTVGDAQVGMPRTEERFLTGPPRIAPLFTDLDPSQFGASVTATQSADSIKFTWNKVPEFSETPFTQTNTFSVTLFANGDILFEYPQVNVTPDDDLHSIVGVTPGGGVPGGSTNLLAGEFQMAAAPIYQVFRGTNFTLAGRTVRFLAGPSTELYFPVLTGDAVNFTGIAVTNYAGSPTGIVAEAFADSGASAPYPANPASEELAAGTQWARLGQELFDSQHVDAWVIMRSLRPEVASFFQIGNGLQGRLTRMDGGTAFTGKSGRLHFTRILNGPGSFPTASGFRDAWTWLVVANPNSTPVTATFRYFNNFGAQVSGDVSRNLPPYGRVVARFDQLLGIQTPVVDGWVDVTLSGGGAAGFSWIDLGDTLIALNASSGNPGRFSYSAQLGHGADIFTSLKVVNPTETAQQITLTAFIVGPGNSISTRVQGPFGLGPRQSLQQDVGQLFGLGPGGTQIVVGSIQVESTAPGVIGDVVFGDPVALRYAAALPLQTQLFRNAIHSQVSNGVDPTNRALSSFTGLALFNPQSQATATVTIRVYNRLGVLVGERTLQIPPRSRISDVLASPNMVPESAGLVGGYIRLISNQPIVGQQLFGNSTLDYLSAVPPAIVE